MHSIAENWKRIQEGIATASNGRSISVVGVTKFQPSSRIVEAIEAGLSILGVNYAQDGEALREQVEKNEKLNSLQWHFIGHIQSRKVKYLMHYDCVQSLDRIEIAVDFNRRLAAEGRSMDVLVEVNIANETNKSGVGQTELPSFLAAIAGLKNLRLRGLMGMPPAVEPVAARRGYFKELFLLFNQSRETHSMDILSMGTSEDYLLAIEEGATMVRLGTVLFGSRG